MLFQLFINSLKPCITRNTLKGAPIRFLTALDMASNRQVQNKNGTRFKKRQMKRQWEELNLNAEGASDSKRLCDEDVDKIKKRKVALLMGYCGVGYNGMQRNPGVPTIEDELFKALHSSGLITETERDNPQQVLFQRSSRTDKGVSAARQVVSLKLPPDTILGEINSHLPECIRVFGMKRVTNRFNSKVKCNARTYSYTVPSYAFESDLISQSNKYSYRMPSEKMAEINALLDKYRGTKSYHNFTERKHHQDPSSLRYILEFKLDKLFVESELEFATLVVKGQSFMLHQIRKMVGLTIAIARKHTDASMMDKAFGNEKVIIPTAPGLGLVLDTVHYDRYDAKFKKTHASLTWEEEEPAVQEFYKEHILPVIVEGEVKKNSISEWITFKLTNHSYDPNDILADENCPTSEAVTDDELSSMTETMSDDEDRVPAQDDEIDIESAHQVP